MLEVPRPTFDYDTKKVTEAYTSALKKIQVELNSLFLTPMQRANIVATQMHIRNILSDIEKYGSSWASASISSAALEGVAATMFVLGDAKTMAEALQIAKFNKVNREYVAAAIADTQSDLLAVTQNVDRQTKLAVRKATAEVARERLTVGDNAPQSFAVGIRDKLVGSTNVAIIDSASRRWTLEHYLDMLTRTKMMAAHREASINEAIASGAYYGVISRHGAKDGCKNYEGLIVKLVDSAPGNYDYIENLSRNEIFHPNCKHTVTPLRDPLRTSPEILQINGLL